MKVLVTGAAGFIGMHTALRLLARGDDVVGIDNMNDYYSPELKRTRVAKLQAHNRFTFIEGDVSDRAATEAIFSVQPPQGVVHLAAQAGVRHSLTNPHTYWQSNLVGFGHILEGCRRHGIQHLVYASSSSVYGGNKALPFSEHHNVDHPVSLYAATKKANELMAHTYSHLFGIPTTGLRFFTVYGPWGRPDMSPMLFANAILQGRAIDVFNLGDMTRDFTFIDDIVEGIVRVLDKPATASSDFNPAQPTPAISCAPYRVFNIGNGRPTPLMEFIRALEQALGVEARKNFLPMQAGDVQATSADTRALEAWVGFRPNTPLKEGVQKFVEWHREYFKADPISPYYQY